MCIRDRLHDETIFHIDIHDGLACPMAYFILRDGEVAFTLPEVTQTVGDLSKESLVEAQGEGFIAKEFVEFETLMRASDFGSVDEETVELSDIRDQLNAMNLQDIKRIAKSVEERKMADLFAFLIDLQSSEEIEKLIEELQQEYFIRFLLDEIDDEFVNRISVLEEKLESETEKLYEKYSLTKDYVLESFSAQLGSYMNTDALVTYEVYLLSKEKGRNEVGIADVPLRNEWIGFENSDYSVISKIKPHSINWNDEVTLSAEKPTQYDIINTFQVAALFRHFKNRDEKIFRTNVDDVCEIPR